MKKDFVFKTIFSIFFVTLMLDGSTGGTDITNRIIQLKMPQVKLSKIVHHADPLAFMMITDADEVSGKGFETDKFPAPK